VFGIATSGGHRGQTEFDWKAKAGIFTGSAMVTATMLGALLGLIGEAVPASTRVDALSLAAVGLLALGVSHLWYESGLMIERDCETAQSWMELGPVRWALVNGAALGAGFWSRIGIVCWYVIPLACFGFGHLATGAIIFGLYGAARGAAVWAWAVLMRRHRGRAGRDPADMILAWDRIAKRVGAGLLLTVSVAGVIIVGL
jgi:hypothetical protein